MGKVYLFTGDDESTISREARKTVEKLVGKDPDDFALEVLRETDDRDAAATMGEAINSILTPSFLGGEKTIWLQNFSAFGEEAAASEKKPSAVAKAISRLSELIKDGLPEDVHLVLSGTDVHGSKSLARACKAQGEVNSYAVPELNRRGWERQVETLINREADERGMKLTPSMVQYLVEAIGVATGRLANEIEKLYCFAGSEPTMEQVREICVGTREAGPFALSNAFGSRDLNAVFTAISQSLDNAKNVDSACIALTRNMGTSFRRMLHMKILMSYENLRNPNDVHPHVERMSNEEKARYPGNMVFSMSSGQKWAVAKDAVNYSGPELLEILGWLATFDKLNVSSSLPRRLALETLALRIVTGQRQRRR